MITRTPFIRKRMQLEAFGFLRFDSYISQKNDRVLSSSFSSSSSSFPSPPLQSSLTPLERTTHISTRDRLRRSYFTNGQVTKKDDPYAILGLEWGDGATTAEIRQAFRKRAKDLHPDVVDTTIMSVEEAHEEFQKLAAAYEALMNHVQADDCENMEEWRVALWRQSDRIALDRNDVAGVARKRPAKPAQTPHRASYGRELGHPSGKGVAGRGEFLSDGITNANGKKLRSSSVGRGQSKWVGKKEKLEYKEWQPSR
mmetsp:Transcript_23834/g.50679  ORF Transcript_23834/g.50679 Transcript_23834/m.50679 type:complete len:255 (+) Transcript_23834:147-911(+)